MHPTGTLALSNALDNSDANGGLEGEDERVDVIFISWSVHAHNCRKSEAMHS